MQGSGDRDDLALFRSERGALGKCEVAATRGPIILQVALSAIAIAGNQIQDHQAPGRELALLATSAFPNFLVGVTGGWIAMAVQEFGIGELGIHCAVLCGAMQVVARFRGLPFALHLPGAGGEIFRWRGKINARKAEKYNECRYEGFHGGYVPFPSRY